MTVIVESGATKSDWLIIDGSRTERRQHPGMNVSTMPLDHVRAVLRDSLSCLGELTGASFYMYTAGVVTPEIRSELKDFILSQARFSDIDIQTDLVGAARSVLGDKAGIVAIMGTGSNTCFYDGQTITQKVMSGGYVIGDDGSGAALGRLFLSDFIKNLIPSDVARDFASKFDASYAGIVENVYRSAAPSGYLGSLAPFVVSHYSDPWVHAMVDLNFQRFIDRSLKQYDTASYPLGIVGGFGYACRDIFTPLCEAALIRIAGFVPEPILGLLEYHCGKSNKKR